MERVTWGTLEIELTRRCNLKCAHCARGDAQNIDIGYNVLDNLFDRTRTIQNLSFIGGEPFLVFDKMKYALNRIMNDKIKVFDTSIVTNGMFIDNNTVECFKHYFLYIKSQYKDIFNREFPDEYIRATIRIEISADKYHKTDVDELYNNASRLLGQYADIRLVKRGDKTFKAGRAKELDGAYKRCEPVLCQIQVYGKNHSCHCMKISSERLENQLDFYNILCAVYVNAKGYLCKWIEDEYVIGDDIKYHIANLNEPCDIVESIDKYNKGKCPCTALMDYTPPSIPIMELSSKVSNGYLTSWVMDDEIEKVEKSDMRYQTPYQRIADDYKNILVNSLNSIGHKEDNGRSKEIVLADMMFPGEEEKIFKSIKIKYPFLSENECKNLTRLSNREKLNLVIENYKRKIIQQCQNMIRYDIRKYGILKEAKMLIDKGYDEEYIRQILLKHINEVGIEKDALDKTLFPLILLAYANKSEYTYSDRWNAIKGFILNNLSVLKSNLNTGNIECVCEFAAYILFIDELKNSTDYKAMYQKDILARDSKLLLIEKIEKDYAINVSVYLKEGDI